MQQSRFKRILLVALVAVFSVSTSNGPMGQENSELKRIEEQIEESKKRQVSIETNRGNLDRDVSQLRQNLIQTARIAQRQESKLTRLEAKLPMLEKSVADRATALHSNRKQMQNTLAGLERLSRNSPHAILLLNEEPLRIVRSVLLLRTAIPHFQNQATLIKKQISEIVTAQNKLNNRHHKIKAAARLLGSQRDRLNNLMLQKISERKKVILASKEIGHQLANLNKKAKTLSELFSRIRKFNHLPKSGSSVRKVIPKSTPDIVNASPKEGEMTQPARGELVERFGQDKHIGSSSKGATYKTRQNAQVVAPFAGKVVFAGPFKGYSQILIIQHGKAYHTLLAGMQQVDVLLGQHLLAGEPVGIMGNKKPETRLYVEVRRKGQPINPIPWFVGKRNKVRG